MIHFNIDAAYRGSRLTKTLRTAAETALNRLGSGTCSLSIAITGDKDIRQLNKQFRGFDEVTDVLSFSSDSRTDDDTRYLGDVVISLPRARAQAKAAGHPINDELQLLVVHGILHLAGHDHADRSAKAKMWALQTEILQSLGVHMDVDKAVAGHSKS